MENAAASIARFDETKCATARKAMLPRKGCCERQFRRVRKDD